MPSGHIGRLIQYSFATAVYSLYQSSTRLCSLSPSAVTMCLNLSTWYSKVKGKVVPVLLTKHHAMKSYGGVELYLYSFFDHGTRWRCMVIFTPRLLYPQGKIPWYPLDRRLGGPPEPFWTRWWREKFPALAGNRTLEPRSSSPKPSAISTELSRLSQRNTGDSLKRLHLNMKDGFLGSLTLWFNFITGERPRFPVIFVTLGSCDT
jgi:hypothetical protein